MRADTGGGLNPGYRRMRRVATGLLVLMAAVYVAARTHEAVHPAIGFVRAFAEAAMVGGLADWFAVTALFRHPLGLPIPHTAIIPRNKDRIGTTLAAFLKDNFLVPSVVARRMQRVDVGGALGRFLSAPAGVGRGGVTRALAEMMEALDPERLGGLVKAALLKRLGAVDFAPPMGAALAAALDRGRHRPVMDAAIDWAGRTLVANELLIRRMVEERSGSVLRWTGLDAALANRIMDGLLRMADELADDQEHPLRLKAEEALHDLARRLQTDPAVAAQVAHVRDELIGNPALRRWLDGMWERARAGMLRAARDPGSAMTGQVGEAVRQLGRMLEEDPRARATFNRAARRAAVGVSARYGNSIVRLVSDTVRGWDAGTITRRLEGAVGRDLQYIRVNGTLVGGLVGVTLHLLSVTVFPN